MLPGSVAVDGTGSRRNKFFGVVCCLATWLIAKTIGVHYEKKEQSEPWLNDADRENLK
jgi:hypothetical protein